MTELSHLFGVSISRIKELFDLFAESGYDLNQNSDWKEIKRKFFNITEEKTDLRNELKKKGQLTPKINNQLKTIEKEDLKK